PASASPAREPAPASSTRSPPARGEPGAAPGRRPRMQSTPSPRPSPRGPPAVMEHAGPRPARPRSLAGVFVYFRFQDADVGQMPVVFRVVEAVADHELVRNLEAHVVGFQRHP